MKIATLEDTELVQVVLPPGGPDTVVEITTTGDTSLRELLVEYVDRCDAARVRSSWCDVVTALGHMYASNTVEPLPDCSWEITPEVMDKALQVASEGAG